MNELFNEIMAKKEEKEKVETEKNMSQTEVSSWPEDMIADYFIWIMQKKGQQYIEPIVDKMIEKLKGN